MPTRTTRASQFVATINWGDGHSSLAHGDRSSRIVRCERQACVCQERALHGERDGDHGRSNLGGYEWLGRSGRDQPPKHRARARVIHRVLKKPAKPREGAAEVVRSPGSGSRELESECVALVTSSMELQTMTKPIRVAVTGAGGQIGYALLFRSGLGGGVRAGSADFASTARNHAGTAGARWDIDGARGLCVPAFEQRDRDRQAGAGV